MKSLIDINIEKSRSGVYQDTSENRRLHRVGQRYGEPKKEEGSNGASALPTKEDVEFSKDGSSIVVENVQTGNTVLFYEKSDGKWFSGHSMVSGGIVTNPEWILRTLESYNRKTYSIKPDLRVSDIEDLKKDKKGAQDALKRLKKKKYLFDDGDEDRYDRGVQSLQNKIDILGQEITRRKAEKKGKPEQEPVEQPSSDEGVFTRVSFPDIPNAHKVNLTKYLSAKRKKAVDDAWDKAKFDSLPREKAGVFQEGYNKLREQFNTNFDSMSKAERAELLYKILKMKNAMERKSTSETKVAQKKVSSVVDERLNVTPLSDPVKYSENARNSVEKKNLVEILRSVGKPVKEEETETGTYGIYKVGNSYIQVVGSDVTTGLKRETSKNRRLGMPGHKRWYGGGESFNKTDKSETFSVYDSEKMNLLIEKLKEGK